jgi:transcription termination factor Rho
LEKEYAGILEILEKGFGFVRQMTFGLPRTRDDIFVSANVIRKYKLRNGCKITGIATPGTKGTFQAATVDTVCDISGPEWQATPNFNQLTVITPEEQLVMEYPGCPASMRILDLIVPVGKGQRGLIVSPPRAGKTVLMQQIADAIAHNYPDVHLIALLVDERPEEVTDMRRSVKGEVFASCNDNELEQHVRLGPLVLDYARRRVEAGQHVVILLDSLTRLGRSFNANLDSSGRTLSGGMDVRGLETPKKMFGSARNIEEGGSLSIIATILVDTGSRMDELIFQEFKGTGNCEIVLDRDLANNRVFPAINIPESGTRKEEKLLKDNLNQFYQLRRYLQKKEKADAMESLLRAITDTRSNKALLANIQVTV